MDKIGKCVYSQRNEMEFLFVEDVHSEETISLIKQFICKYTTLCFSKKANEKVKFKKQFNGSIYFYVDGFKIPSNNCANGFQMFSNCYLVIEHFRGTYYFSILTEEEFDEEYSKVKEDCLIERSVISHGSDTFWDL